MICYVFPRAPKQPGPEAGNPALVWKINRIRLRGWPRGRESSPWIGKSILSGFAVGPYAGNPAWDGKSIFPANVRHVGGPRQRSVLHFDIERLGGDLATARKSRRHAKDR